MRTMGLKKVANEIDSSAEDSVHIKAVQKHVKNKVMVRCLNRGNNINLATNSELRNSEFSSDDGSGKTIRSLIVPTIWHVETAVPPSYCVSDGKKNLNT